MTIVEREQLDVQVDERERRASVLEAAALEIEVRGWDRTPDLEEFGVCLLEAIACAEGYARQAWACAAMGRVWWGVDGEGDRLWRWNDHDARDAADVTFVLRWRAQEIRDGR